MQVENMLEDLWRMMAGESENMSEIARPQQLKSL